jgi:hypothetical protein
MSVLMFAAGYARMQSCRRSERLRPGSDGSGAQESEADVHTHNHIDALIWRSPTATQGASLHS